MIPDHPFIINELAEQRRKEIGTMVQQMRTANNARLAHEQHDALADADRARTSGARALLSRLQAQWPGSLKRLTFGPDH
jgi:hypothetical protein